MRALYESALGRGRGGRARARARGRGGRGGGRATTERTRARVANAMPAIASQASQELEKQGAQSHNLKKANEARGQSSRVPCGVVAGELASASMGFYGLSSPIREMQR